MYYIDYGTGAGNEYVDGTLDDAKKVAEDGIAYTQTDVKIRTEHGEDSFNDYVITAAEIGKIAKSLFSLPIESEITKKVNVKFNKTDLAYIHSLYVKSLHVGFSRSKTKGVTYNGRTLRTLIQCKKDKGGELHYNFTAFYEVISKLAIEYLVK